MSPYPTVSPYTLTNIKHAAHQMILRLFQKRGSKEPPSPHGNDAAYLCPHYVLLTIKYMHTAIDCSFA